MKGGAGMDELKKWERGGGGGDPTEEAEGTVTE